MPVRRYESAPADVQVLGQPITFPFSGTTSKNRFKKAAMAEDLATWSPTVLEDRGIPTKESIELYKRYGEGGWGIITTGNMDIEFDMLDGIGDHIITPECAPSGPRFDAFAEMARGATAHGSLLIAQVTHPGRQLAARIRKDTIAPSAIQLEKGLTVYAKPREATASDIARVIEGFAHAAAYLQKAGFSGMELHAAHGYLLSQFLSAESNRRTDGYGGSLANRTRIVVEIAEAVQRRVAPGFVLGIKINSVEFQDRGMTPDEAGSLCETLERVGYDYVELSGGNHADIGFGGEQRESSRKREAYFVEFVKDIAPRLDKTKTFLVGGLRTAGAMVQVVERDGIDGVALGRAAAQEPRLPRDMLEGGVTGAIRPVDLVINELFLGLTCANVHLRQIAKGQEPVDLSDPDLLAGVQKDIAVMWAKVGADGDKLEVRGSADVSDPAASSRAYGVAY
ncbi:NADH:flavin oxidoreductase/NADH oxidase-like protein [Xylariomycetidae sp. FL2044]|nr:NADH:flavin oxidoreductase/NADH oxidase-like protein [Xylariomycetidae sp. FL2044]